LTKELNKIVHDVHLPGSIELKTLTPNHLIEQAIIARRRLHHKVAWTWDQGSCWTRSVLDLKLLHHPPLLLA